MSALLSFRVQACCLGARLVDGCLASLHCDYQDRHTYIMPPSRQTGRAVFMPRRHTRDSPAVRASKEAALDARLSWAAHFRPRQLVLSQIHVHDSEGS